VSYSLAGITAWIVLIFWSAAIVAQSVPAASTPATTPSVGQSGAGAVTPAQGQSASPAAKARDGQTSGNDVGPTATVWQWKGLIVDKIEFQGVTFGATDLLPKELTQKVGVPLNPLEVRASLRRLYASGRYRNIEVKGVRDGDRVTLIFAGVSRYFVGRVTISGVKSERLTSLLEFATKLSPGTAFSEPQIAAGTEGIKQILQQQGYYEPKVSVKTETDVAGDQVNATYTVTIGPQARVGQVVLLGTDTGLTAEEFRKKAKLKENSKVTRDTTSNALDRLRKQYQKNNRLEATVTLQKQTYDDVRDKVDYEFHANQGPEVKVLVEGVKISTGRLHLLVPIFEEGTIDNDLLNEGVFNIRDYEQQQGYFDSKVDVKVVGEGTPDERVVFTVDRGAKHRCRLWI
jgi:outer membrane protein insertion porin family